MSVHEQCEPTRNHPGNLSAQKPASQPSGITARRADGEHAECTLRVHEQCEPTRNNAGNRRAQKPGGWVLLTTLLLLALTSGLVCHIAREGGWLLQLLGNYDNQLQAFEQAEGQLLQVEQRLTKGEHPHFPQAVVERIDTNICGADFYRITTHAEYHGAVRRLSSVIALPNSASCTTPPPITEWGRQTFTILTNN